MWSSTSVLSSYFMSKQMLWKSSVLCSIGQRRPRSAEILYCWNYRTIMSLRDYFIDRKPRKTTISSLTVPCVRYPDVSPCFTAFPSRLSAIFHLPPQRWIMFCPDITCAYLGWEFSSYILSLASLKRLMVCFVLFVKLSMTTRKYSFSPRISILPSYLDRMVRKCW